MKKLQFAILTTLIISTAYSLDTGNAKISLREAEEKMEFFIKKLASSSTEKSKIYYQKKIQALLKKIKANKLPIETPRLIP